MKIRLLKLLLASVVTISAFYSHADTETVNGITWKYTISDGGACISHSSGPWTPAISSSTTGVITIPSTLGGYPVTSIGRSAFYGCSSLTSVKIPDSVTSIGDYVFYSCSQSRELYICDTMCTEWNRFSFS